MTAQRQVPLSLDTSRPQDERQLSTSPAPSATPLPMQADLTRQTTHRKTRQEQTRQMACLMNAAELTSSGEFQPHEADHR